MIKEHLLPKTDKKTIAKDIADDTLRILDEGRVSYNGKSYKLSNEPDAFLYVKTPDLDSVINKRIKETKGCNIYFTEESILKASYRWRDKNACALNFASATNCGGGFMHGAIAQEETIARSSNLYPLIKDSPYYDIHNQDRQDYIYTDSVIYSKEITIFKNDKGDIIEPYKMSFITCAAPMCNSLKGLDGCNENSLYDELCEVFANRIDRILKVAAIRGHRNLILGAWGCGAFGNDPEMVASAFRGELYHNRYFDNILFPIYGDQNNLKVFKKVFGVK